ncbi:MAG: hypothetical protein Q9170_005324 [Blastenia crenularia]
MPSKQEKNQSDAENQNSETAKNSLSLVDRSVDQQSELPARSPVTQKRSLFVHSLPASATTDSLTEFFSQYHPLKHATVVSDRTSNLSRGYGFVTFADPSDASMALLTFNDALFDGKRIKVELAEPRLRGAQPKYHMGRVTPALSSSNPVTGPQYRRRQAPGEPSPRLIVRNLPWTINSSEELAMLFRSYGKVKEATIPEKRPGLSTGFGFVLLRGRKNAEKALNGVNGKVVGGRTLAVDWAVRKDVWDTLQQSTDINATQRHLGLCDETNSKATGAELGGSEFSEATQPEEHNAESMTPDKFQEDRAPVTASAELIATGSPAQLSSSTIFIRNVPFTATDETLSKHFTQFGPLRYARMVMDPSTGRSKGTAFVCFANEADAIACLQSAPKTTATFAYDNKHLLTQTYKKSILEDTAVDYSGRFSMDGRLLQFSRAVDKGEATRLTATGHSLRDIRDRDKRRLYLLGEGTISNSAPLYQKLAPSEISLRQESARQRQSLIKNNPALHLSLTRLSVRNLPRSITSKDLKGLAREAVVGFAQDVKEGRRQPLSKEELSRAGELMREAESTRKAKGKGIVKQSKIVFEGKGGGKVAESSGAGRSKGYGFIEYTSHRWALMGLRWLNGHAVDTHSSAAPKASNATDRKKRLIVEFAIENSQVVSRRQERAARSRGRQVSNNASSTRKVHGGEHSDDKNQSLNQVKEGGGKRKRAIQGSHHPALIGTDSLPLDGSDDVEIPTKKQKIVVKRQITRKVGNLS